MVIGAAVLLFVASFLDMYSVDGYDGDVPNAWENLDTGMGIYLGGVIGAALIVLSRMLPAPRKVAGLDLGVVGTAFTILVAWVLFWTIVDVPDGKEPKKGQVDRAVLLGPTSNDRLTMVTSGERSPLNGSSATIVTAKMIGRPFEPTFQGAKTNAQTSLGSGDNTVPSLVLAVLLYSIAIGASIAVYRKLRFRVAYVITIAPLVAITIITAEALSRLIPSWT